MITLPIILELLTGLLKFPKELLTLVRVLQKTPQEHHAVLMKGIEAESENFRNTGRPS